MLKEYTLGVLWWWYAIHIPNLGNKLIDKLLFILQYTGTLPMAQNLNKPLYQDNSSTGKLVGVVIRGTWVWLGGTFSLILLLPFLLSFLFQVLLPVIIPVLLVMIII